MGHYALSIHAISKVKIIKLSCYCTCTQYMYVNHIHGRTNWRQCEYNNVHGFVTWINIYIANKKRIMEHFNKRNNSELQSPYTNTLFAHLVAKEKCTEFNNKTCTQLFDIFYRGDNEFLCGLPLFANFVVLSPILFFTSFFFSIFRSILIGRARWFNPYRWLHRWFHQWIQCRCIEECSHRSCSCCCCKTNC